MALIPQLSFLERWRLLTPLNIHVRQLWPWGYSIQKIVAAGEPKPRESAQLLIASDYGGEHRAATHLIYCYLVVRGGANHWVSAARSARSILSSSRTMSYKRLDDRIRQNALAPFLVAAADLDAHLVAIAVDKKKKWLSTMPGTADDLRRAFGLKATWNPRAFEAMMRKVQFVAILLSIWSRPYGNVTWITDQDEFVANDTRHDDALQAVARFSSFYLTHPMRTFRLNTTAQDPDLHDYEDLCAIPDLAAGMLSDVSTRLTKEGSWEKGIRTLRSILPLKADIIADWFWDDQMRLRKTLITMDVVGTQYRVEKVSMTQSDENSLLLPTSDDEKMK
jgi:hypothetical protein